MLIIEEQLCGPFSHHFEYLRDLAGYAASQGWHITLLCNRGAPDSVTGELGATGCLYSVSSSLLRGIPWRVIRWATGLTHTGLNAWVLFWKLARQPRYEIILVPTASIPHLLGLAPALLLLRRKIPRVCFQFLCDWDPDSGLRLPLLRSTLRLLTWIHPGVHYFAQTTTAANDLTGSRGPQVRCAPDVSPTTVRGHAPPAPNSRRPFTFGFYGFGRHEQGVDVLQDAIAIFLENYPDADVRFRIIWSSGGFHNPAGQWIEPRRSLEQSGKVVFFRELVPKRAYLELLESTDWVILPYRVKPYARRSSLAAVDAVCRGIPVIFSEGTAQEILVREYGSGLGLAQLDPAVLAALMFRAFQENSSFQIMARDKAAAAQATFSPAAFWRLMAGDTSLVPKV